MKKKSTGDSTKTEPKRRRSLLLAPDLNWKSPYRHLGGRGAWICFVGVAVVLLFPLVLCRLPDSFQRGPWAGVISIGWIALFLVCVVSGADMAKKERAAYLAAHRESPEEEDLLIYISAFLFGDNDVRDQAAPIVVDLLGRLSEEKLAYIPNETWIRLCPPPQVTRTGYAVNENVARADQVLVAVFSAIMRIKRVKSLPAIESWVRHPKTNCHSGAFLRTLHACHKTLLNHQDSLSPARTLLRAASTDAAAPEVLLRAVSGTHPPDREAGAQLLRAFQEEEPRASGESE